MYAKSFSIHHHYTCTIGSNRGWVAGRTDVVQHGNLKYTGGTQSRENCYYEIYPYLHVYP